MSTRDAYNIPTSEIIEMNNKNYSPVYGELTKTGLFDLLQGINKSNKVFADLGSGSGNVVINAINRYPSLKKSIGIEYSKHRHLLAVAKSKNLSDIKKHKVNFYNSDMFEKNFKTFDIIYISNLCFKDALNKKLGIKLSKELKENTYIFASQPLTITRKHTVETLLIKQTWGDNSTIYKYHLLK